MTKIRNIFNNGKKFGAKLGVVNIGSYNVAPNTITALAAASAPTISRSDMNLYDYFKVDQGTGATNQFHLPDAAELGESFVIYAVTAFEMHTQTVGSEINGDNAGGFNTVAKSMYFCTKTAHSTDEWAILGIAEAGSVESITVNVAP